VIECITEILRLLVLCGITINLTLLLLGTGAMLTTLWTRTTLAAVTALTSFTTVTTLATLWTLTALTTGRSLYVVSRFLNQYTMRELVLTCLRINLKELHLNVVTLLDTSLLNGLKTLPVNL
jgi:hypothetical protein